MKRPLVKPSSKKTFIHETAVVEPGAELGLGVNIWHHCHVRNGATIGDYAQLGKNVYVDKGAVVGNYCRIQNNVSIYRGVTLEDSVFVGPSAVFTNDLYPRVGKSGWAIVPTVVHNGASIGANVTIVCGTTIGPWAMIGAGSVVTKDVGAYELVIGNPAHRVGWVCSCGQIIERGADAFRGASCGSCGRAYPPNQ